MDTVVDVTNDVELTIRYSETQDGFVTAEVVEVPAAQSFGRTREEARDSVLDALRELALSYLEDPREPVGAGSVDEIVRIHAAP